MVHAQKVEVRARVSQTNVALDQEFVYSIIADNASPDMDLVTPNLSDFNLVRGPYISTSDQMTVSGNQVKRSSTVSVDYVLRPKRAGTFVIKGGGMQSRAGTVFEHDPVRVTVSSSRVGQGSIPPDMGDQNDAQPSNEPFDARNLNRYIFLKAEVDKTKVVVGEQVNVTYKLYTRLRMAMMPTQMPQLNGFWAMEDSVSDKGQAHQENYNGQRYEVHTIRKVALFPQQAGTLKIDAMKATGWVEIPTDDMFGFSQRQEKDLSTQPVEIQVSSLPSTSGSFSGAVGRFSISSSIQSLAYTTDDAIQLTFEIIGKGNIGLINAPTLDLPSGLNQLTPSTHDSIQEVMPSLYGSRKFVYTITADSAGHYTIPAINFTYFDTDERGYKTLSTAAINLSVSKGKGNKKIDSKDLTALQDIHNIKTEVPNWNETRVNPLFSPIFWFILSAPPLLFLAFGAAKRRKERLGINNKELAANNPEKMAKMRLEAARKAIQNQENELFYEEVSKALSLYLSDKLNVPLNILTKEKIHEQLSQRGIQETLIQETLEQLNACEKALYTPDRGLGNQNSTLVRAEKLISTFETQLNSKK